MNEAEMTAPDAAAASDAAAAGSIAIEAQNLSKHYGQFAAVSNISFTVGTGTVTAFLGPNGAGKINNDEDADGLFSPVVWQCSLGWV